MGSEGERLTGFGGLQSRPGWRIVGRHHGKEGRLVPPTYRRCSFRRVMLTAVVEKGEIGAVSPIPAVKLGLTFAMALSPKTLEPNRKLG